MTLGWRLWLETIVVFSVFAAWTSVVWAVAKRYYEIEQDRTYVPPFPRPVDADDDEEETVMLLWPTDGRLH